MDPDFDFIRDQPTQGRNRSHDLFAHELLESPPYDGLLASRSLIEGASSSKRYSQAQKYRVLCEGLRAHFRYPTAPFEGDPFDFPIMGDCGSFSYVDQRIPPYGAEDTLEFYRAAGVQYGVAPDHIILEHNALWDKPRLLPPLIEERLNFTLRTAQQFLKLSQESKVGFVPIGAIQCWSPGSSAKNAVALVRQGYRYLGLGGLVARKTDQIYEMVSAIRNAIPSDVKLHLFGFSRIDDLERFSNLGIDSFDSTSPMLKSFKDDEFNYFDEKGKHLIAIRIPPRDEAKVKQRIQSGQLNGEKVRETEDRALSAVRKFDLGKISIEEALEDIHSYETLLRPDVDYRKAYRNTLQRKPWKDCPCAICRKIGIEVILHRNLNRHKRRGFHNLYVLHKKVVKLRNMKTISVPCLRIEQSQGRYIYSFAIDGKAGRYISMLKGAKAESPPRIKSNEYFCFKVIFNCAQYKRVCKFTPRL